ncbi:UDP-N-acetylmuramoyl-L-alanyl-D-glutamate--2,6-diaminopimelate ligase, partial [bacterium]|nr:UDP-N-acetylmuramoyl-L-alanyl-D-glutamate--2,6-diaminopimelate ligase [bacterium]
MKELKDILKDLSVKRILGDGDKTITGVTADSREVSPGYLFIAVRGTKIDGHEFIGKAAEAGAVAVICENLPDNFSGSAGQGVTMIVVDDSAAATGMAASAFYDHPSRKLRLTGVTGTNGKTTIATLLYNMFD